jgi:5-oxoprolinase (ATP-hydrolysing) subunit A
MQYIDVNCDMGESTTLWPYNIEHDIALLPFISSINIACGCHAGDAFTMQTLVQRSMQYKVALGAHPSFMDKENFGRTNQQLSETAVYELVFTQIKMLDEIIINEGAVLHHVKPHGALYNMAAKSEKLAIVIANAVKNYNPQLVLYALSGSAMIAAAKNINLQTCSEVFADRTYQNDGMLTPRTQTNALIKDEKMAVNQVLQIIQQGYVTSVNHQKVKLTAQTICLHSDGKHALAFAKNIYKNLQQQQIQIKAFTKH